MRADTAHVIASLALLLVVLLACNTKRDHELVDKFAEAQASEKAAKESAYRAACKVKADASISVVDYNDIRDSCQETVLKGLKAPSQASFPSHADDATVIVGADGCSRIYKSWVDSPNPLGVILRTRYTCMHDPKTGLHSITFD